MQPSPWSPPPGYEPAPSALEGVTVWRPIPTAAPVQAPVTFTCPNCGASTRYDVAAGGVACEHCGYTAPAKTGKVGRGAQQFEFTVETMQQAVIGWGVERQELRCDNCGAITSLAQGVLSATCPFCASNKVNLASAPSDQLRPRFLVPFKVQPEANHSLVRAWLGKGWFHPAELGKSAVLERFTGIYLPFWTFDARIDSDWKAQVGYERQESYYDAGDKTWKTRTVIDWRWETGLVSLRVDDLLVDGTTHASTVLLERLRPYSMEDLVEYAPDYLAGWQAQAFDVNLPEAWERGKASMREMARTACREDIHSPHVRNFSMSADFCDESWRYLLLPVYLASYPFEGKVYQVMVNGQTGAIAGQKPVTWWKVWVAIAALLLPALGLGLPGLILLPLGGAGVIPLVLGFVLLVAGGVFSVKIYRDALASEAA